jgi:hypothetical protein
MSGFGIKFSLSKNAKAPAKPIFKLTDDEDEVVEKKPRLELKNTPIISNSFDSEKTPKPILSNENLSSTSSTFIDIPKKEDASSTNNDFDPLDAFMLGLAENANEKTESKPRRDDLEDDDDFDSFLKQLETEGFDYSKGNYLF